MIDNLIHVESPIDLVLFILEGELYIRSFLQPDQIFDSLTAAEWKKIILYSSRYGVPIHIPKEYLAIALPAATSPTFSPEPPEDPELSEILDSVIDSLDSEYNPTPGPFIEI